MAKKVQLLTADSKQEILHPETTSDMVQHGGSTLDVELDKKFDKTGGTITGNLTVPMVNGALNGNASSATKLATARTLTIGNTSRNFDGTANLTWTLANIGALPLTGGTVTGDLTVNGTLQNNTIRPSSNNAGNIGTSSLRYNNGYFTNLYAGGVTSTGNLWHTTNAGDVIIQLNSTSGASGALRSYRAATDDVGSSAYRWRNIWASNGTIQTSDERYKADIQDIDDEQFFEMVKGTSVNTYVMLDERKDKMTKISLEQPENKQATANSERVQVGIIAQDMAQFDCAKYILVHDEETDIYSVNNYNFTSAVMGALKVEIQKREELEDLVLELKKEVDTLKAKVA